MAPVLKFIAVATETWSLATLRIVDYKVLELVKNSATALSWIVLADEMEALDLPFPDTPVGADQPLFVEKRPTCCGRPGHTAEHFIVFWALGRDVCARARHRNTGVGPENHLTSRRGKDPGVWFPKPICWFGRGFFG